MKSGSVAQTEKPVYPTWIRSSRIVLFWALATGVVVAAVATAYLLWLPGLAIALLALPFVYIATVLSVVTYRLGPRGGDLQNKIHQLLIDEAGTGGGRLLDVGCGSGQLLIRYAKSSPGDHVGVDYWGDDWAYSKQQAERNAKLEGVPHLEFVHGSASRLPFPDARFARVVSCLTFHEVREAADKTISIAEALRVLEPGGRFVFVDLFDDPAFYGGRERVLAAVRDARGEIESVRTLSEIFDLRFPMNQKQVLKYAVVVAGTRRPSR
ncbi:class I SAM-dependent methyltransferase [Flindersiella endophytica]